MATVNVITMGCSKNLVDSQKVVQLLSKAGVDAVVNDESFHHDFIVINTCGFIGDAKEESIEMILDCCQAKDEGITKGVYVMGCLSQRYSEELPQEMPEVDQWFGKFDWKAVAETLKEKSSHLKGRRKKVVPVEDRPAEVSQYIKIAEGCNRFCAFCAIPLITGRFHSRTIEDILEEVRSLASRGAKEFNIIAQDLSAYGTDLYGEHKLAQLIDRMADIEGVEWIRLHYAYPTDFPMDVLDVMARRDNVCKYLDIALQHSSDPVLTNMRRHITSEQQRELLAEIRRRVPGIHIRTTLMVGFPGEDEKAYKELLEFTKEQKFERMGAFAYCEEDDTYAAKHLKDDIEQEVKDRRLEKLMRLQEDISLEHNQNKVGKVMKVLVTEENPDYYVGRTEFDSPEVDPEVLIEKTQKLIPGEFYMVEITAAEPFELYGRLAQEQDPTKPDKEPKA